MHNLVELENTQKRPWAMWKRHKTSTSRLSWAWKLPSTCRCGALPGLSTVRVVHLKYPQHTLLAWWIKAVPPSWSYTLWCKVLQPLAGWFLSLCNLRIERKLEKTIYFHTKSRSLPFLHLSFCWMLKCSSQSSQTWYHVTPPLLGWLWSRLSPWDGDQPSHWCASRYLDNSLSWNWGPFLQKSTHRVSKNYSGIKCQQRRLIWNSNCWIIYSAMSR